MVKVSQVKLRNSAQINPRNGGTWSEAKFWGAVRSHLRRMFRFNWVPAKQALERAKRKSESDNPRLKWEFFCCECKGWFPRKAVELDHIVPCGSLRGLEDLPGFLSRLLPESADSYQVVCKECHKKKTAAEREARKAA